MKKVLIVDDELFVRKGLMSLIDWDKCGFEVIGDSDNGEDALEMIQTMNPDLVITDIRMPVLDGLGLIKRVTETNERNPKFIIITGYNDFTYAQAAIRYGVQDFILKPIEQDELEHALIKIEQLLSLEESQNKKQKQLLIQTMFRELTTGKINADLLPQYSDLLMAGESADFYYLLLELFGNRQSDLISEDSSIKNTIQHSLNTVFDVSNPIPIQTLQGGKFGVIVPSAVLFKENIKTAANKLVYQLKASLNMHFSLYVGIPVSKLQQLKESYDTAHHTSLYKYGYKTMEPIFYEEINESSIRYTELSQTLYTLYKEKIEENNLKLLNKLIDSIFNEFQSKQFTPQAIKSSLNYCVNIVVGLINSMDGEITKVVSFQNMIQWDRYNFTLEEMKYRFITFSTEAANVLINLRKEHAKGDIHKIKSYIESHYHENISLKSIANTFFMNPVYMGQLFKKSYGVYFKEFLLDLRITEAKQLLRQTNMRVYEVSDKVGFGSTDYFVTQFEKIEGITPTEYRNRILK